MGQNTHRFSHNRHPLASVYTNRKPSYTSLITPTDLDYYYTEQFKTISATVDLLMIKKTGIKTKFLF